MSDIHLEFYKLHKIPTCTPVAKYLALCGDIGYPFSDQYEKYLEDLSGKFKMVFLLAGNHEYYQGKNKHRSMKKIENKIEEIANNLGNVYFLQRSFVALDAEENFSYYGSNIENLDARAKYIISGSTLWTNIPDNHAKEVRDTMNDYEKIFLTRKEKISVGNLNLIHNMNVNWINSLLNHVTNMNTSPSIIMLSHHSPTFKMINKFYEDYPTNCAFASDLEDLIRDPIKIWISGHTHGCMSVDVNDVICVSNCKGYKFEKTGFREDKTVEII